MLSMLVGISSRPVSVCLSHAGIVPKPLHVLSWCWHTYPTLCFKQIRVISKNKSTSICNSVPSSGLIKFDQVHFLQVQQTSDSCCLLLSLLITPGNDGGCGEVLSTVDQQWSTVEHTHCPAPALCIASCEVRHEASCHVWVCLKQLIHQPVCWAVTSH